MASVFYTIFNSQLTNGEFHKLLSILPQKDQKHILRFKHWRDRQIHLAGRLLLLKGLLERGLSNNVLESVESTEYGKLFLNGNVEFNLSNSGMSAVCAITDIGQIGIDVETVAKLDVLDFKAFMSIDEWNDIQQAKDKLITFFTYWTKKEAVIKADGRGFNAPFTQIQFECDSAFLTGKKWFIKKVQLDAPYICHLATSIFVRDVSIQMISPGDLGTNL